MRGDAPAVAARARPRRIARAPPTTLQTAVSSLSSLGTLGNRKTNSHTIVRTKVVLVNEKLNKNYVSLRYASTYVYEAFNYVLVG